MILLDTDVVVDILRRYPPAVSWLGSLGDEEILLPGFAAFELIEGCRSKAEQRVVEKEIRTFTIAWAQPGACSAAFDTFSKEHLSRG